MAINYANLAALAERLIRENGRDALLITETNTGTDYQPTISQTSETIKLCKLNLTLKITMILYYKRMMLSFSVSAFVVSAKQRIETNGLQYSIVAVKEIRPSDTSILYIVQGRL